MPIPSKMRTLADAGLYKYKWCNNLREVEQVDIFFLKDIADTIRYLIGNNIGLLYHNKSKLFVLVPDNSIANAQYIISQLFNSNIVVEYQNNTNLIEVLSAELGALLGEGNFTLTIDNDTQTLYMAFTSSIWNNKMNEVESVLKRVLSINLDIKFEPFPLDFTELEFLEYSGTQYSEVADEYDNTCGAEACFEVTPERGQGYNYNSALWGLNPDDDNLWMYLGVYFYDTIGVIYITGIGAKVTNEVGLKVTASLNKYNNFYSRCVTNAQSIENPPPSWGRPANTLIYSPKQFIGGSIYTIKQTRSHSFVGKLYWIQFYRAGVMTRNFIPVLDKNGVPCMWDKISRTSFYNSGSGTFGYRIKTPESEASTFSLRDPYYTAPSGIWAKLIAENELDIIADTDMQDGEGQGYTWFANTGEAYEHFGIKEEPLNNI